MQHLHKQLRDETAFRCPHHVINGTIGLSMPSGGPREGVWKIQISALPQDMEGETLHAYSYRLPFFELKLLSCQQREILQKYIALHGKEEEDENEDKDCSKRDILERLFCGMSTAVVSEVIHVPTCETLVQMCFLQVNHKPILWMSVSDKTLRFGGSMERGPHQMKNLPWGNFFRDPFRVAVQDEGGRRFHFRSGTKEGGAA